MAIPAGLKSSMSRDQGTQRGIWDFRICVAGSLEGRGSLDGTENLGVLKGYMVVYGSGMAQGSGRA